MSFLEARSLVARIRTFRTARQVQASAQARKDYDQRRARESETRRLYWTQRWRRLAKAQLAEHPLCIRCEEVGIVTAASICDHRTPHRGDVGLFWSGPFDSLCKPCHDSAKQREEAAARRGG